METRTLPDLRLRQRNRHVRRGDLRGHIRLRRPHHPRRRVLPHLPRPRGYSHLHPPLQFCGLISFVAPPSARQLVSDPSMAHWPENGREALSPPAFQRILIQKKNRFGFTFNSFHFRYAVFLTLDYTGSVAM